MYLEDNNNNNNNVYPKIRFCNTIVLYNPFSIIIYLEDSPYFHKNIVHDTYSITKYILMFITLNNKNKICN